MASYDSDSSMEGDEDFTETNVLLGYASKEPADDTISHLGGRPTWLDPATPPSAALARCKVCHDIMVLLLQLNGGLPDHFPDHERRLYLFICRRKTCRRKGGSVRVVRGVRGPVGGDATKQEQQQKKLQQQKSQEQQKQQQVDTKPKEPPSRALGESLFGAKPSSSSSSMNPFSTSSTSATSAPRNPFSTPSSKPASSDPFAASGLAPLSELSAKAPQAPVEEEELPKTFAAALSLNNDADQKAVMGPERPPEPWPIDTEQPAPYPLMYLVDVDYEQLDKVEPDIAIPTQTMDLDEPGSGSGGGGGKEDKDVYESTIDKTFQKFADRLAQNPEQVIRYEFRGQPLLYSKADAVGKLLSPPAHAPDQKVTTALVGTRLPRCTQCGGQRTFEMQLAPHAITELEAEEMGLEGMDWGTIIVGTCDRDCLPPSGQGYVEEWAGVQWEEMTAKRG